MPVLRKGYLRLHAHVLAAATAPTPHWPPTCPIAKPVLSQFRHLFTDLRLR
jgi:hypothetical protein